MNIKDQGYSFTLVQGLSDSKFSNFFSYETDMPIEIKFHVEPPRDMPGNVAMEQSKVMQMEYLR